MEKVMEPACANCGKTFTARRSTAKFCSSKCRVYAFRERTPRTLVEQAAGLVGPMVKRMNGTELKAFIKMVKQKHIRVARLTPEEWG
jgi:hypothetical protein